MPKSANRNITRIDRKTTGGYLVRITRRGKLHAQLFADRDYGGKRKALAAAKAHRDHLEQKLRGYSRRKLAEKPRVNNTSGIAGVRYVEETDPRWKSKPTYRYWIAQWSPQGGGRRTAKFSVEKYGDEEAYRLAVKARRKGLREMEG